MEFYLETKEDVLRELFDHPDGGIGQGGSADA